MISPSPQKLISSNSCERVAKNTPRFCGRLTVFAGAASMFFFILFCGRDVNSRGAEPATALVAAVPTSQPWTARLSNGVEVELIGVCENLPGARVWWHPDGSPLAPPAYVRFDGSDQVSDDLVAKHLKMREFAFRVTKLPAGDPEIELGYYISPFSEDLRLRDDEDGNHIYANSQELPADTDKVTVQVGVAVNPWRTIGITHGEAVAIHRIRMVVQLSAARDQPTGGQPGVAIWVSGSIQNVRILAIDKEGRIHRATAGGGGGSGGSFTESFPFANLSLKDVNQFEVQVHTNNDEWTEFKNVSANPTANLPQMVR